MTIPTMKKTTMREQSPWDEIVVPGSDLNVRQIDAKTAVPCYWGRDASGSCLLILELQGNHLEQFRSAQPKVSGLVIDLRAGGANRQNLIFALGRQVDRDLFAGLCRTLVAALEHASDSASSLAVALEHVRRWKSFLAGRAQSLSPEEVRGLFAEIRFLIELVENGMPGSDAVDAWLGPDRSHQDFIFGNTAVEIKSLSGAERSTVRISSEDQLEPLNDVLYLRLYRLSDLSDATGAQSLNAVVDAAREKLGDAGAVELFEQKLVMHGYIPVADYDKPRFVVSDTRTFSVASGFPRLIRSCLQSGIANVRYDLKLEALAPFECANTALWGK